MTRRKASHEEQRFALLFVFLLAASIAISFYIMLPHAAFESQRIHEQTLIDRGEQYKRAIQLFYRKFKKYPADLSALEDTNNLRFLRKRYKDPMTGADEWRLIHISSEGVLTDSLIQKPDTKKDEGKSQNTFITEGPAVGTTIDTGSTVIPNWKRRRGGTATDGSGQTDVAPMPGMEGQQGVAGTGTGDQQTGTGATDSSGQQTTGDSSTTASTSGDANVQVPVDRIQGITLPAAQELQSQTTGSTTNSASSQSTSGQQTATGSGQSSLSSQSSKPASSIISNMLTGASTNAAEASQRGSTTGETFGGGLAGVATKYEAESIKLYNERQKYQEWEFVYDYRNDRANMTATGTGLSSKAGASTSTKTSK